MKKSLFGYGLTTRALSKSGGWDIYDDKFETLQSDEHGNCLRNPRDFDPSLSELEIPSPGFPSTHELVKKAQNLTSEYDYFLDPSKLHPKSVWISGTNGKTTTTKMTEWLLRGVGAQMGGNVGVPLAYLDPAEPLWILETSSFTMHYTRLAAPEIYALLPITPDHLSWHGNMAEYERAKLSPLALMKEGAVAIIPAKYAGAKTCAKVVAYENEADLAAKFELDLAKIKFEVPFLADAVLALSIAKLITGKADYERINSFVIEGNKLEEFHDARGRTWVNDTKATNIDAAIWALRRYAGRDICLILGGDDKGVDLSPVFEEMRGLKVRVYAIGSNAERVMELAKKYGVPATKCVELTAAVKAMSADMSGEQIGILSPACASLDQFSSYVERGETFKKAVLAL